MKNTRLAVEKLAEAVSGYEEIQDKNTMNSLTIMAVYSGWMTMNQTRKVSFLRI